MRRSSYLFVALSLFWIVLSSLLVSEFSGRNQQEERQSFNVFLANIIGQDVRMNDLIKVKSLVFEATSNLPDVDFICIINSVSNELYYIGQNESHTRKRNIRKCRDVRPVALGISEAWVTGNDDAKLAAVRIYWKNDIDALGWVVDNWKVVSANLFVYLFLISIFFLRASRLENRMIEDAVLELVEGKKVTDQLRKALPGLAAHWGEMQDKIRKVTDEKIQIEKKVALWDLAKQVAHDIRSPLTALDIGLSQVRYMNEDQKTLVEAAQHRIKEIADDLLARQRIKSVESKPVDLKGTVQEIINEKRLQYGERGEIQMQVPEGQLSLKLEGRHLKRVLSNLINNSFEAIEDPVVKVKAVFLENHVALNIEDNGPGFDQKILPLLGRDRISDKENGHGLGIEGAVKAVDAVEGSISFSNGKSGGAIVNIKLPRL